MRKIKKIVLSDKEYTRSQASRKAWQTRVENGNDIPPYGAQLHDGFMMLTACEGE